MTFLEKLKQINDEAYSKASEEKDRDAHTDLVNRYGEIVSFMGKGGYKPTDEFIEPY